MSQVEFESVRKVFRHRPALFNWIGRERSGETVALADISFATGGTEVVALLGPNGSGKTSALKLISTMLLPDRGSVRIDGFDSRRAGDKIRRQVGIAVATERSFFPRLSARENLDFFAALDEVPRRERGERIEEVLQNAGLEEQRDTLVMKFSSGMYQRLGLARALIKGPKVLLLDEPSRSLDAAATAQLWTIVRRLAAQHTTVFLATHNFSEAAALADRLLFLHRGALLADRALAPHETSESLRSLYLRLTGQDMPNESEILGAIPPAPVAS
jgi:ABC-type multidrug transport system ATPase subunit